MLNLYDQTLHSTLNLVNLDEFGKIVQKMYDANVIALFPSIGNFFMAECFRQNMLEIGKDVIVEKQIFYQTKVAETPETPRSEISRTCFCISVLLSILFIIY